MYKEDQLYPSVIQHQNNFIFRTFVWMIAGLLVTAACAWFTYASNLFWYFLYENTFTVLLIAELVVVVLFSFLFRKLPPLAVGILYFAYAVLNGYLRSISDEFNSVAVLSRRRSLRRFCAVRIQMQERFKQVGTSADDNSHNSYRHEPGKYLPAQEQFHGSFHRLRRIVPVLWYNCL